MNEFDGKRVFNTLFRVINNDQIRHDEVLPVKLLDALAPVIDEIISKEYNRGVNNGLDKRVTDELLEYLKLASKHFGAIHCVELLKSFEDKKDV
jgi:hypothetical protein